MRLPFSFSSAVRRCETLAASWIPEDYIQSR